jgi:hypothetical protein
MKEAREDSPKNCKYKGGFDFYFFGGRGSRNVIPSSFLKFFLVD